MLRGRSGWLARPWFFAAVALLALNDHVFKAAWPGWVTGKLSDFAGLVVVATLVSVVLGHRLGTVLAGLGFVGLKTVPGVAELVAPLLGGVTLRDPSDLIALLVLPGLWVVLGRERPDQAARTRRGWAAVGLVAAVLTTTATSSSNPPSGVDGVGYLGDAFFAEVYLADGYGTRWLRSEDGGATWTRTDDPGPLPQADALGVEREDGWQQCAADQVCYRVAPVAGAGSGRAEHRVERLEPGGRWLLETVLAELYWTPQLAVNPEDSAHVLVTARNLVFFRAAPGDWREADLVEIASDPEWQRDLVAGFNDHGAPLVTLLLVSLVSWLVAPSLSARWVLQVFSLLACGYVSLASIVTQPVGQLTMHAIWAGFVILLSVLLRLSWWYERRTQARAAATLDPSSEELR